MQTFEERMKNHDGRLVLVDFYAEYVVVWLIAMSTNDLQLVRPLQSALAHSRAHNLGYDPQQWKGSGPGHHQYGRGTSPCGEISSQ